MGIRQGFKRLVSYSSHINFALGPWYKGQGEEQGTGEGAKLEEQLTVRRREPSHAHKHPCTLTHAPFDTAMAKLKHSYARLD